MKQTIPDDVISKGLCDYVDIMMYKYDETKDKDRTILYCLVLNNALLMHQINMTEKRLKKVGEEIGKELTDKIDKIEDDRKKESNIIPSYLV